MKNTIRLVLFITTITFIHTTYGQNVDQDLLNSLKIEANHNLNRLKSLKTEKKNTKIYDDEREKALGQYLVEQERLDLIREKGLAEYRKQKKALSPADGGPEFKEDQKRKQVAQEKTEKSRETQVRTRNKVLNENPGLVAALENEELGLTNARPRYDIRKRGQNRWVKSGSANKGTSGSSSDSFNPAPRDSDFPPPPSDYMPPPPPTEGYEEIPPPPPPTYDYGSSTGMPYDSGYGEIPPPPPPPPPVDYDF